MAPLDTICISQDFSRCEPAEIVRNPGSLKEDLSGHTVEMPDNSIDRMPCLR